MGSSLILIVPFVAAAIGAGAWLLRRRLTPERTHERYDLAGKMIDVRGKLFASGHNAGEVDALIATLESDPTGSRLSSALKAFSAQSREPAESDEPAILHTTAAMGVRMEARLNVVDAEIEQLLVDVEIASGHLLAESGVDRILHDEDHVRKMHRAWKQYRKQAARSRSADYAGGSISGVVYVLEEIRIAEVFLQELKDRMTELTSA